MQLDTVNLLQWEKMLKTVYVRVLMLDLFLIHFQSFLSGPLEPGF